MITILLTMQWRSRATCFLWQNTSGWLHILPYFLRLSVDFFWWSPEWITCLHFTHSSAFSPATQTTCMSSFTASINLFDGLPLPLIGGSIISFLLQTSPASFLCTCSNNFSLVSHYVPESSCLRCPSDILISNPFHLCHSQREQKHPLHIPRATNKDRKWSKYIESCNVYTRAKGIDPKLIWEPFSVPSFLPDFFPSIPFLPSLPSSLS